MNTVKTDFRHKEQDGFFYYYLSVKMQLLKKVSVAAWFFKGETRLSWFYIKLKSIKIKFDVSLFDQNKIGFNGPLIALAISSSYQNLYIEEKP